MRKYTRREAIETLGISLATAYMVPALASTVSKKKQHFITLSFDDGFKKSSIRTAEIFEKYK